MTNRQKKNMPPTCRSFAATNGSRSICVTLNACARKGSRFAPSSFSPAPDALVAAEIRGMERAAEIADRVRAQSGSWNVAEAVELIRIAAAALDARSAREGE